MTDKIDMDHAMVEDLDELINIFKQLDSRLNQHNERFYLRCCIITNGSENEEITNKNE